MAHQPFSPPVRDRTQSSLSSLHHGTRAEKSVLRFLLLHECGKSLPLWHEGENLSCVLDPQTTEIAQQDSPPWEGKWCLKIASPTPPASRQIVVLRLSHPPPQRKIAPRGIIGSRFPPLGQ
ncbi:NADH dehydrogenase [Platysternon megacephalum]|uniref:NADH dehydrogenase n=1 Tax=Platysternon megacephalum TaxID=55544 RepID=A0A4D9DJ21_9SAUR|nr:NADH dehydrogenase [Platysternon megacephalum]